MEQVIVDISTNGTVKVEVSGVQGQKCIELTEDLESELGVLVERKKKPEIYDRKAGIINVQQVRRG